MTRVELMENRREKYLLMIPHICHGMDMCFGLKLQAHVTASTLTFFLHTSCFY
jgi:hypothetical protein